MLCHNQQCSYTHWIVHANYDSDSIKDSRSQDKRFISKKHAVVDKILNELKQKQSCEDQLTKFSRKDRDIKDCILIPKDPTSPNWILHANYDIDNAKDSRSQDKRFISKKHAVVDKFLNEFKQKQSCEDRDLKDCILIPKDPTAPYAFTVNPYTFKKQKKKYFINQVVF